MTYHVEVDSDVSEYVRNLEGFTRIGRLNLFSYIDALRNYGDEARQACSRNPPDSMVFRFNWTFDAGPAVRTLTLYVDDSQAAAGILVVLYAELAPLDESE